MKIKLQRYQIESGQLKIIVEARDYKLAFKKALVNFGEKEISLGILTRFRELNQWNQPMLKSFRFADASKENSSGKWKYVKSDVFFDKDGIIKI